MLWNGATVTLLISCPLLNTEFRNYLPSRNIVYNTYLFNSKDTHAFPKYSKAMILEFSKTPFIGNPFVSNRNIIVKLFEIYYIRRESRDIAKWRNRNTSHLISAWTQAFKTNPEMLLRREYQYNVLVVCKAKH